MNHFNFKTLAFYGATIGSVLLLFKVVTAYGENNLKAPIAINGRYRLAFQESLPTCEKSDALILDLQQSGIYLNGLLLPVNPDTKISKVTATKLTLAGRLTNQEFSLSGKVPKAIICNVSNASSNTASNLQNNSSSLVNMQIQLADPAHLSGQITLSDSSKAIAFTATPQKTQKAKE
jgi:hypothetical protein